MRISKMRYFFPIGTFLFLFLDGSLSHLFAPSFFTSSTSVESRLILLWLVLGICYGKVDHLLAWSAVAGLFFDLFYTGVLGIFTLLLPFMVYLTRNIVTFFNRSFIVVLLIYLIDITILTTLFYWVNALIGFTSASAVTFIARTLGPTLAYNLAGYVILYWPLKMFFEKFS
ncbi:rod shape-determining protein MreD [Ligilactobacillus acidipiscis]|uniref:Rod shape-determining protein MreD n=1 Tax=Ligilactobacillus acidipiscis TaxID=89059 RepID=A0A1K1KPN7_9LACO|nr:rod shape-determining protein MreD [Ligilactobacillus acidipiscis]MCI1924322.1 rod shape-determining protein MreD [Ligilactobacillus acidipiscis]MCI1954002.1 rod shape-determining protein MreD [Ligilactobacillus acidipiscis]WEV56005.1 rod shape-determining protein MreD [Ligilactobacillus acidipiscis]SFV40819.1 rod shape-determining protein MreD [Ligilactobacillus acidipiscis]